MRWLAAVVVVGLAACTEQNPAFAPGNGADGEANVEDAATVAPMDADAAASAPGPPADATAIAADTPPLNPPVDAKAATPDAASTGLQGAYYNGNAFNSLELMRVDPIVDFSWDSTAPDPRLTFSGFSVRWTGKLRPLYSETYTFTIHSGDGARLWLNNILVIDDWQMQAPQDEIGTIQLTANQLYDIKIEYLHQTGYSVMRIFWQSPSQTRVVIPSAYLLPQ